MKIEGIEITHPEKIIFPELNVTKLDMVNYYDRIGAHILLYLKNRVLTIQRFPDGISQNGFYQKHAQEYYPNYIKRITIETEEGKVDEIMCNNKKSLIYLVNQGTVTFHTWLSCQKMLHRPDKVVFDLDPAGSAEFSKVRKAATIVRKFLQNEGLQSNLMTTGKAGLHLYYSIKPSKNFDQVRTHTREIAEQLVKKDPDIFTLEMRKNKRENKIFLDYLRNAYGQTTICPFSLRPNSMAGVATPLEWHELNKLQSGNDYNYTNIFRRLGAKSS